MYITNNKLTIFAEKMNEFYEIDKDRESEIKNLFNKEINFSARYIGGRKLIPLDNILGLKLGYRKSHIKILNKEYRVYEDVFKKFKQKLVSVKYAKKLNTEPLIF